MWAEDDYISLTFDRSSSATNSVTVHVKDKAGNNVSGVSATLESTSITEFKTGSATALSRTTNSVLAPQTGYANEQYSTIEYTFKVQGLSGSYYKAALDVYAMTGTGASQYNNGNCVRYWTFDVATGTTADGTTSFVTQAENDICTVTDDDGGLYHKLWEMSGTANTTTNPLYIKVTLTKTATLGCFAGIREVRLYTTTYKYAITFGNSVVYTSGAYYGSTGSTISTMPSDLQREYCNYTVTSTTLTDGANTIPVTCSYPFTVSSSFATATWYYAKINTSKYLRADDSKKDGSGRYQTNSANGYSNVYKWAFFGNPYDGIYVMNKGQGDGKYLYKGNSQPEFKALDDPTADNKAMWVIRSNSQGGFALQNVEGGTNWCINDAGQSGNLGYWNDYRNFSAAGSNWVISEDHSVVLSELSNIKKYKIHCERGDLSTRDGYLASTAKSGQGISAKDFAIINYNNKYYLYSVDDKKFVKYGSSTSAPLTDDISDYITFTETASGSGLYSIRFNGASDKNLNSHTQKTYGYIIDSWTTLDAGNQYAIEEVDDFDPKEALGIVSGYNNIIATLKNVRWGLTSEHNKGKLNYYNFIGEYFGNAGNEMSIIEGLESQGYSEENLQIAQGMNNRTVSYALNMPAAGKFYRIKGNTSSKYLASGFTDGKFSMTDATDASTIFYYDANNKLTNLGSGMCNGMNKNNWSWVTGANASVVTFQDGLVLTDGGYAIKSADDAEGTNAAYLSDYGSSGYADRGSNMSITSSTDEVYTNWYLEEVTSLPITNANGNCYTSFSAPVAVTIPSGCKAYMATEKVGSVIRMTEIEGSYIAANTGIIIGTEDGSAINFTFPIYSGNELANTDGNILSANVVATAIAREGNYFFGKLKNSTDYVFTTLSGEGDNYTLPGFKAYLPTSTTGARLAIVWGDGDPTGLIELNGIIELKDGKYYQNGKVIVVRNGIKYNVAGQIIK